METESHTESTLDDPNDEGIGEFDDGKTGKLTLAILLAEDLIHPGEKVRTPALSQLLLFQIINIYFVLKDNCPANIIMLSF